MLHREADDPDAEPGHAGERWHAFHRPACDGRVHAFARTAADRYTPIPCSSSVIPDRPRALAADAASLLWCAPVAGGLAASSAHATRPPPSVSLASCACARTRCGV